MTKVYNFHVPGPESYIANNLVTHNCYVARHREFGNRVEMYSNRAEIHQSVINHCNSLGKKTTPNQCDPVYWTYDIGESTDCGTMPEATSQYITAVLSNAPEAKTTFATKYTRYNLHYSTIPEPLRKRARIRISLMPERLQTYLEGNTTPIKTRIGDINNFIDEGFEVHINYSPVVLTSRWLSDYKELFEQIEAYANVSKNPDIKSEVIFLTHNQKLSESNRSWAPLAEELLWRPSIQELKVTQNGDDSVVRYKWQLKAKAIEKFKELYYSYFPNNEIRYIF